MRHDTHIARLQPLRDAITKELRTHRLTPTDHKTVLRHLMDDLVTSVEIDLGPDWIWDLDAEEIRSIPETPQGAPGHEALIEETLAYILTTIPITICRELGHLNAEEEFLALRADSDLLQSILTEMGFRPGHFAPLRRLGRYVHLAVSDGWTTYDRLVALTGLNRRTLERYVRAN